MPVYMEAYNTCIARSLLQMHHRSNECLGMNSISHVAVRNTYCYSFHFIYLVGFKTINADKICRSEIEFKIKLVRVQIMNQSIECRTTTSHLNDF